jgi:hypothetical protein
MNKFFLTILSNFTFIKKYLLSVRNTTKAVRKAVREPATTDAVLGGVLARVVAAMIATLVGVLRAPRHRGAKWKLGTGSSGDSGSV